MSKPSIYDRGWLNVVFEGRNQAYGAYQLRRQSGKTTLLAFLATLLLFGAIAGIPAMASKLWDTKPVVADALPHLKPDSIRIIPVDFKRLKFEEKKASGKKVIGKTKPPVRFVAMVPSKDPDPVAPPTNTELDNRTISDHDGPGDPKGGDNTGGTAAGTGTDPVETDTPSGNEPMLNGMLDRNPEFPGGLQRFYEYVGRNFRAPEEETGKIRVMVSFVVERDGSLTDVKVLRNPGYGMDKEAIRVLKSLKAKWSPGIYKGQKVRTLYTLPIVVDPAG